MTIAQKFPKAFLQVEIKQNNRREHYNHRQMFYMQLAREIYWILEIYFPGLVTENRATNQP